MSKSGAAGLGRLVIYGLISCLLLFQPARVHADDVPGYTLGPGDKIHVTVFGEADLSGDFDISDQGIVALPLIGPVNVNGKTISEAETLITARYAKDYLVNPRVNVAVLNYRPFYILGEVQKPGSYPYVSGLTVINAVALAGGYTPRANTSHIVITRASDRAAGEKEVPQTAAVFPGDVVRVPERFF